MRSTALRLLGFAALATVAVGCGDRDDITSPAKVNGTTASRTILGSPTSGRGVTRNTPLATALTASAVIGAFGGKLSLPGAGLTVIVPAFALASPTRITVTAVAGNRVAYEFEPHGTRFLVPLVVTQSLSGTSSLNSGMTFPVVYFSRYLVVTGDERGDLSNDGISSH